MTTPMSPETLAELERLAKAATPGPREAWSSIYEGMKAAIVQPAAEPLRTVAEVRSDYADACYLSAVDPTTILKLTAALRSITETNRVQMEALKQMMHAAVQLSACMAMKKRTAFHDTADKMFGEAYLASSAALKGEVLP